MTELIFSIEQNLIQIEALRLARIKTPEVEDLLCRRIDIAKRDVNKLRRFGNRKNGTVGKVCFNIANEIERRLYA